MQTHYLKGMPGELLLIRHGETEWSRSGQHTSRTDLALTDRGRVRAKALGEILKGMFPSGFALVLSSPMRRAIDTCHLAGYQPEIEDNLREWDYGSYEGLTSGDIQKTAPGWTIWTGAVPGGESAAQVGARADRVIQRCLAVSSMELARTTEPGSAESSGVPDGSGGRAGPVRAIGPGGNVALFSHGHMLRVLAARWLDLAPDAGRLLGLDTASISALGWEHTTRVIRFWNRTA
jgi:broad specificity phosphatase PhoE